MPRLFLDLQISPQGRNHTGYVTHKSELPAGTVTEIPAEVLKWLPAQIRGYVFPYVYQASKFSFNLRANLPSSSGIKLLAGIEA